MNVANNTVLITGGSGGIGLALAERFAHAGSRVAVCGRHEESLAAARQRIPGLMTRICDVSQEAERQALYDWARAELPDLNVLVNNAGIQNRNVDLGRADDWSRYRAEIATNVDAPIHLSMLFLEFLAGKPGATIINVSSGLAFTPMVSVPVYCATKAAIHNFTLTLRSQAARRDVGVVEIIPPAVQTNLGGAAQHTWGTPLAEFADGVFASLQGNEPEIGYGSTVSSSRMSRDEIDATFERMNSRNR